jgi:hypothetical protein
VKKRHGGWEKKFFVSRNIFVLDWVEGPITEDIVLIRAEFDPIRQGLKAASSRH